METQVLPNHLNSVQRRKGLLKQMDSLGEGEINCQKCYGKCCTFRANSMQSTPLETLEVLNYLKNENRWDKEIQVIEESIREFRLDYDLDVGSGEAFRRTYTCPFYNEGPKGCSIPPKFKPYGCLAFNPRSAGVSDGEDCASDIESLEQRELENTAEEEQLNTEISAKLNLSWQKLPLPVALMRLDKLITDTSPNIS